MNQVKRFKAIHNNHLLPSFFILGERKCGTSSLFRYLCQHSQVVPGKWKEPNFFVQSKEEIGSRWDEYAALFPHLQQAKSKLLWPELDRSGILFEEEVDFDVPNSGDFITGEASANTLVEADPEVVTSKLPHCQFIIVLRDPVWRSFSHYRMLKRFQEEGRDIGMVLRTWPAQVDWEMSQIEAGKTSPILFPSIYIQSILRWQSHWKKPPIILGTHQLEPDRLPDTLQCIFSSLGLAYESIAPLRYNQAPPAGMDYATEVKLRDFFQSYNRRLFDYLKIEMPWI